MVRLLTPQEVAEACQLSARTVVRAIERGDLRASKLAVRGGWRILPADIDDWLAARSNRRRDPPDGERPRGKEIEPDLARLKASTRSSPRRTDGRLVLRPGMGNRAA
ncbi:MAG: helix-turn-helix domain-containing protein [Solirubrobacteraceae bacterium]